jgi:hypothetical protein
MHNCPLQSFDHLLLKERMIWIEQLYYHHYPKKTLLSSQKEIDTLLGHIKLRQE